MAKEAGPGEADISQPTPAKTILICSSAQSQRVLHDRAPLPQILVNPFT